MRIPLILLLLSLICAGLLINLEGPTLTATLAVSLLSCVAAVILSFRALVPRRTPKADAQDKTAKAGPIKRKPTTRHVVIDGSNVMHWDGEVPRLTTLRDVVSVLRAQGYQPGAIFDANAGYKLCDRYLDDCDFAKLLGLPGDRVLVVGSGEPADPTILAAARDLGAKVITNDRFRDWAGDFPEVATSGHLVQGGYRDGALWLDERALLAAA